MDRSRLAEQYAFLKRPEWVKRNVLDAGDALEQLPVADRGKMAAMLDKPGIPPVKALQVIESVAAMSARTRRKLFEAAASDAAHIRRRPSGRGEPG